MEWMERAWTQLTEVVSSIVGGLGTGGRWLANGTGSAWTWLVENNVVQIIPGILTASAAITVAIIVFNFNKNNEAHQARNHAYYVLFNAWISLQLFKLSYSDDVLKTAVSQFTKKLRKSELYNPDEEEFLVSHAEPILKQDLSAGLLRTANISAIKSERVFDALDELSKFDPILAADVSRLCSGIGGIEEHIKQVEERCAERGVETENKEFMLGIAIDSYLWSVVEEFEEAIVKIAASQGKKMLKSCHADLDLFKKRYSEFNFPQDYIDSYLAQIESCFKVPSTESEPAE